jgi:hypothetical protein
MPSIQGSLFLKFIDVNFLPFSTEAPIKYNQICISMLNTMFLAAKKHISSKTLFKKIKILPNVLANSL